MLVKAMKLPTESAKSGENWFEPIYCASGENGLYAEGDYHQQLTAPVGLTSTPLRQLLRGGVLCKSTEKGGNACFFHFRNGTIF